MTNLAYNYPRNPLTGLNDRSGNAYGFNDIISGDLSNPSTESTWEYKYDDSGNLVYNNNNDVDYFYNHLNLPYMVDFNGSTHILEFTFDATGAKLDMTKKNASQQIEKTIHYVGNMVYSTNASGVDEQEFMLFAEGRIVKSSSEWIYEYHLTDHQGNTRVAFTPGTNGPDAVQKTDYYPFGKQHEPIALNNDNKYLYNGKEYYEDHDLDWLAYGFRMYDPEIGRWNVPEPLAGMLPGISPYAYALNDPVNNIDRMGLWPDWPWEGKGSVKCPDTGTQRRENKYRTRNKNDNGPGGFVNYYHGYMWDQAVGEGPTGMEQIEAVYAPIMAINASSEAMRKQMEEDRAERNNAIQQSLEEKSSYIGTFGISGSGSDNSIEQIINEHSSSASKGGHPTIYVDLYERPKGFNTEKYTNELRKRLLKNGFSNDIEIDFSRGINDIIADWWYDNPTVDVKIRKRHPFFDANVAKWAGGYSRMNAGFAVIFSDSFGDGYSNIVSATLHEIGHALFGFKDIELGEQGPLGIMNYNYIWSVPKPAFTNEQINIIQNSSWGK